jgi:hypothetical protein
MRLLSCTVRISVPPLHGGLQLSKLHEALDATQRSFGLSQLGLSRLIPAYLLSHNTIHSTIRALFLESAEQALSVSSQCQDLGLVRKSVI